MHNDNDADGLNRSSEAHDHDHEFRDEKSNQKLRHDMESGVEAVSTHPRAHGAPSASINDPEYRLAAKERGEGVNDDNESTIEGFPVPVIAKTDHAKSLHDTAAHEVATVDQATRSTDIAGDTTPISGAESKPVGN